MNKAEFLAIINKELSVLQDSEISDIAGEYSQHIDMKISEGMTEEEAINTLGNIDELIDGILEAYHVNSNVATGFNGLFGKRLKNGKEKEVTPKNTYNEEKNNMLKRKFRDVSAVIMKWLRKILILLFTTAAGLSVLFMLFMTGVCIVLLTRGYPLSGVMLVLVGSVLILGAAAIFFYRMLTRKAIKVARINQIICIMLIAGVLLGGIGTGMALAEYSSYEYISDVYLPDSDIITRSVDYEVSSIDIIRNLYADNIIKTLTIESAYPELCEIISDVRVPKDHISAEVTYFAEEKEVMQPRFYRNESGKSLYLYSGLDASDVSILEYKDLLLNNLREHKFGRYCVGKVTGIAIRVNPESEFSVLIK